MKKHAGWLVAGLALMVVWAVSSKVQSAPAGSAAPFVAGTKLAVVDIVQVFNSFEQTKALSDKKQQYLEKLGKEADSRAQQIKVEKGTLDAINPDSAEWFKQNQKVKKMMLDYKVWEEIEKDQITENHVRWVKRTYDRIMQEIEAVAKARGVDMVLTLEMVDPSVPDLKNLLQQIGSRKVVYSRSEMDITNEVLRNLNAAYQKAGGAASVDFSK